MQPPPRSTLFPYTTLFRSQIVLGHQHRPQYLARSDEMVEIGAGPGSADRAGAGRVERLAVLGEAGVADVDRKSTRLNSSHGYISYAVFCLKKKYTHDRSIS